MSTNENQSWTQNDFANQPAEVGQGRAYGVPHFNDLPGDEKTAVLTAYTKALERGWPIPEAEEIAREALLRLRMSANTTTPTPPAEESAEEEPTTNPRKPMNVRALAIALSAAVIIGGAAIGVDRFSPKSSTEPAQFDQLVEVAKIRASAALKLQAANERVKDSARVLAQDKAVRDALQADYDKAWKREACLVAGNCPAPKK